MVKANRAYNLSPFPGVFLLIRLPPAVPPLPSTSLPRSRTVICASLVLLALGSPCGPYLAPRSWLSGEWSLPCEASYTSSLGRYRRRALQALRGCYTVPVPHSTVGGLRPAASPIIASWCPTSSSSETRAVRSTSHPPTGLGPWGRISFLVPGERHGWEVPQTPFPIMDSY